MWRLVASFGHANSIGKVGRTEKKGHRDTGGTGIGKICCKVLGFV